MGFERVALGRTGFLVTRLGIASGYGTDDAMVEEAVSHGVNYLYWGAWRSKRMAKGIKKVARMNREDLIIVAHSMARMRHIGDHVYKNESPLKAQLKSIRSINWRIK